jgi:hypothetical protein
LIDVRFASLLTWPRPSTPSYKRGSRASFRAGWTDTLNLLESEHDKLKATDIVIECGLQPGDIRNDGWPRSNARAPSHPGVVLSFASKHGPLRYLTDRYEFWQHNVRAIALGLQALRTVDRYAITTDGEQYRGWAALPQRASNGRITGEDLIRQRATALGVEPKAAWRTLVKAMHPDIGGDPAEFRGLQAGAERMGLLS